jgi:hypothetical protein
MATVATPSPSVPLPAWAATNSPPPAFILRPSIQKALIPLAFLPQPRFHRAFILNAFLLQQFCRRLSHHEPAPTTIQPAAGEQPKAISKLQSALAAPSSRNESRQIAEVHRPQWLSSRLSVECLPPIKYTFQFFQSSGSNPNIFLTQIKPNIFPPER